MFFSFSFGLKNSVYQPLYAFTLFHLRIGIERFRGHWSLIQEKHTHTVFLFLFMFSPTSPPSTILLTLLLTKLYSPQTTAQISTFHTVDHLMKIPHWHWQSPTLQSDLLHSQNTKSPLRPSLTPNPLASPSNNNLTHNNLTPSLPEIDRNSVIYFVQSHKLKDVITKSETRVRAA